MRTLWTCLLIGVAFSVAAPLEADTSARGRYEGALALERQVRSGGSLKDMRATIARYEAVARRYPTSGYSDNALWQAAGLCLDAYTQHGEDQDRRAGVRYLEWLAREYPSSRLAKQVPRRLADFESTRIATPSKIDFALPVATTGSSPAPPMEAAAGTRTSNVLATSPTVSASPSRIVAIRDIKRTRLPGVVRVSVVLDGKVSYQQERLESPRRLFFDLQSTHVVQTLVDSSMKFTDDVVREIRLGRHPNSTTRVVLDIEDVARYHVFTLENPYRLVIDCERTDTWGPAPPGAADAASSDPRRSAGPVRMKSEPVATTGSVLTAPAEETGAPAVPAVPTPDRVATKYSMSRQLGLGISRLVLDPGHGGHDSGADHFRVKESNLVLDIALRLEKLLLKEPGVEVVLTRRTDVFVPLEERTAIANRENADLFISIHANASRNARAQGVETYFLNFSSGPDAEAVAARENAGNTGLMSSLPDIVRAIALNNKLDESRDFAASVQASLVKQLKPANKGLRDLGVKQAPFIVLLGAGMPAVLAEVSFVTNKQEASLLRTARYRQRVAEALFNAIQGYQRSLRNTGTLALQEN